MLEMEEIWKLERNSAGSTLFLQLDGDKLRAMVKLAAGGRERRKAGFRQGFAMMYSATYIKEACGGDGERNRGPSSPDALAPLRGQGYLSQSTGTILPAS